MRLDSAGGVLEEGSFTLSLFSADAVLIRVGRPRGGNLFFALFRLYCEDGVNSGGYRSAGFGFLTLDVGKLADVCDENIAVVSLAHELKSVSGVAVSQPVVVRVAVPRIT